MGAAVILVSGTTAWAASLTVPDEALTIQAAIDAGVDTVLVRPGMYPETPTLRLPVHVLATTSIATERPVIEGLAIRPPRGRGSGLYAMRDLRLTAPVLVVNDDERSQIRFESCDLGAGIDDTSESVNTESFRFAKCIVVGTARLLVADLCEIDTCQIRGQVGIFSGGGLVLRVRGCTFDGGGKGTALGTTDINGGVVAGNIIRDYVQGIGTEMAGGIIVNNLIEDCSDAGIRARGGVVVANNVIRRCQVAGIVSATSDEAVIRGNIIAYGGGRGIMVLGGPNIEVSENVIHHCAGHGIEVVSEYYQEISIVRNTSCFNGGAGLSSRFANLSPGAAFIMNNIGLGNGQYGLAWPAEDTATVRCNDWFANLAGMVGGLALSPDDFSADPLFCNSDTADFRLRADSPAVDRPGCGQVGALGVGCGVTATVVRRFSAARVSAGIEVIWDVGGAGGAEVWVERSEGTSGEWGRPLTQRSMDERGVVELDVSASADKSYWYRLLGQEREGVVTLVPPTLVEADPAPGFGLSTPSPNPSPGAVRITFTLAHAAAIELEVFDVQGRSVAMLASGVWPLGGHVVDWHGNGSDGKAAPAGWYVVRLRYPGGQSTKRLLRSRS